jgi:hypothetical protein
VTTFEEQIADLAKRQRAKVDAAESLARNIHEQRRRQQEQVAAWSRTLATKVRSVTEDVAARCRGEGKGLFDIQPIQLSNGPITSSGALPSLNYAISPAGETARAIRLVFELAASGDVTTIMTGSQPKSVPIDSFSAADAERAFLAAITKVVGPAEPNPKLPE